MDTMVMVKEKFLSNVNKITDENDRKDFDRIGNFIFNYIYLENKDRSVEEIIANGDKELFYKLMNFSITHFEELTNKYKILTYILNTVIIPVFADEVEEFLKQTC